MCRFVCPKPWPLSHERESAYNTVAWLIVLVISAPFATRPHFNWPLIGPSNAPFPCMEKCKNSKCPLEIPTFLVVWEQDLVHTITGKEHAQFVWPGMCYPSNYWSSINLRVLRVFWTVFRFKKTCHWELDWKAAAYPLGWAIYGNFDVFNTF